VCHDKNLPNLSLQLTAGRMIADWGMRNVECGFEGGTIRNRHFTRSPQLVNPRRARPRIGQLNFFR